MSERHLRRSLEREIGVSPVALAQTHRLLLAKRLLGDTELPVTRVAFASGFQSLRRFNALFRERYRLSPSALRPRPRTMRPEDDVIRLTLTYRAPLAWDVLLMLLGRDALAGVEVLQGGRYGRTVRLDGCSGVVYAEDTAPSLRDARRGAPSHLSVSVSSSLLAVLMPLLARLRHMFDLDAEPTAVDGHLACSGLGEHVRRRRGVRIPGAFDGFEAALRVLLRASSKAGGNVGRRVVHALGEPLETGIPALIRVAPTAERVADAGAARLASLGVRRRRAAAVSAVARAVADGALRLEPGSDVIAAQRALLAIDGIGDHLATTIVMRALRWPDAFPGSDRTLQRAVGASSASEPGGRTPPYISGCTRRSAPATPSDQPRVFVHRSRSLDASRRERGLRGSGCARALKPRYSPVSGVYF